MKRRGFIAAILGLFTFPLWGKKKDVREELLKNGFGPTLFSVEKVNFYSEADLIRKEIAMAAKEWARKHGYNPNQIHLGNKQLEAMRKYVDCTKKGQPFVPDCEMVMGMIVHSEFVIMPPYGNGPGMSRSEIVEDCCRPSYDECNDFTVLFFQDMAAQEAHEKYDKQQQEFRERMKAEGFDV